VVGGFVGRGDRRSHYQRTQQNKQQRQKHPVHVILLEMLGA
jgi:hypothetical protein